MLAIQFPHPQWVPTRLPIPLSLKSHSSEGERQPLTLREREFIRAVVHHDYIAAKPKLYADLCALMRMEPDFAVQTTFDYSSGPVDIYGYIADPEDEDFIDTKDEWLDSIERAESSGGRMALHVVTLRAGRSVRSILVPDC